MTRSDKLDNNTYNLSMLIGKTRNHFIMYDLHNVFAILYPDPKDESKIIAEKDLFRDYQTILIKDVAASNGGWYRKWPKDPTYEQNLTLMAKFFQQNAADKLWEKCYEHYAKHPPIDLGGPLLFRIMLHQLMINTEDAGRLAPQKPLDFRYSRRKRGKGS
jgi:hypothetical protein